jgi:stage V sporulation protein AA
MENVVYVRMRHRVQVRPDEVVKMKHIAKILGSLSVVQTLEETDLLQVTDEDNNIIIVDLVHMIKEIREQYPNVDIQAVGPAQTIIEVIYEKKKVSWILFIAVWLLLFVGAAITIMNFHADVSMQTVHQKLFKIITGKDDSKPLLIQIPYSFGLGLGMILFFNHFFKKRFNEEPSPLEVEMFNYQQDLDQYVIMHENKESIRRIDDR